VRRPRRDSACGGHAGGGGRRGAPGGAGPAFVRRMPWSRVGGAPDRGRRTGVRAEDAVVGGRRTGVRAEDAVVGMPVSMLSTCEQTSLLDARATVAHDRPECAAARGARMAPSAGLEQAVRGGGSCEVKSRPERRPRVAASTSRPGTALSDSPSNAAVPPGRPRGMLGTGVARRCGRPR
jgi:hypothetical protein